MNEIAKRFDEAITAYAQWLIRWRWPVILVTIALAATAGYGAKNLAFKNDYRVFFSEDNPQLLAFEEIQNTYTKNDNIMFVITPKSCVLLEALERPGSSELHISELLKLAEANVPIPSAHDQGILSTPPDKVFIP